MEDILYTINSDGRKVKVSINYTGEEDVSYACYLFQNDLNIKRKWYQKSNEFEFQCKTGTYSFLLFVKSKEDGTIVQKKTESFQVEYYDLSGFANNDILEILAEDARLSIDGHNKFNDVNNLKEYVFIECSYVIENYMKSHTEIVQWVKSLSERVKEVIILREYFGNCEELNQTIQKILNQCNLENVSIIDTHQILQKCSGNILFENRENFENILKSKVNQICKKALKREVEEISVEINITDGQLVSVIRNPNIDVVKNAQYYFYILKDGEIYYKSRNWGGKTNWYMNCVIMEFIVFRGILKVKG